jgi:hypothetical protein
MFAATPGALAGAWFQETKRQLQLIGGSFQHYLAGGDWKDLYTIMLTINSGYQPFGNG